jgi:pyruvate dehydrogenase E1 component alpha subunit
VGGPFPLAAGLGKGIQMKGGDEIAICFLGDAANNQGTFHETMNMVALYKLPVLFVCENNQYGIGTAITRSTAVVDQYKRVCGYGIESAQCDGQDVEVVYEHARRAVDYVRSRKGPYFLELLTYRYRGHSMSDSRSYRSREEEEMWKKRDPIFILRDRLIEEGALTMEEFQKLEKEIDDYIENEVVRFAEESPEPDVKDLEKYVFADRETQLP